MRRLILSLFVVLPMVWWGNSFTIKGSIMEGAILNQTDPYLQMDLEVKKDFPRSEGIRVILEVKDDLEGSIEEASALHDSLEADLPGMTVVSLANLPGYRDMLDPETGEETLFSPKFFDTDDPLFFENGKFGIEKWKVLLADQGHLVPSFVGRDLDYFAFVIYPDYKADEIQVFRQVVETLENRQISALEWKLKTDIYPQNPNILVAGGIMSRGLIDGALNAEIIKIIGGLGLPLAFLAFLAFTRSALQAALATLLVVGGSVLLVRAQAGWAHFLGFGIRETPYILLVYVNSIVQGISFSLHLFDAYNALDEVEDPRLRWRLATKEVIGALSITTLISFFGFITLFSFEVWAVQEFGILSALGVVNLFMLAVFVLPEFHIAFTKKNNKKKTKAETKTEQALDKLYDFIVEICLKGTRKLSAKAASLILIGLVSVSINLAMTGHLEVGSRLLDFLQQTVVEASADYMNASTRPGFDVIEVYVKPKNPEDMEQPWIYDPNFTREVWDLQQDLGKLPEVREVYSILSAVAKVSQETFGKDFPETREEVAAIFMMELENSIASEVLEQFYHENGFRLSVTTAVDYSPDVRALTDAILKTRENRPSIQIFPFGNVVKYAQLDNYIVKGKPWNILTSQGVVVLLSASWIFFSLKGFGANRAWTALKAGLAMSSPFVFSSAMIILVMMALGVPLDIATSSIGAIAINASIDFSIYWTAVYIKLRISGASHNEALERTMKQEGRIVVGDAVLNIIVFCPLRISIFLPIARLGWIMVLMLTFAAIGALVIMPPLLKWAFGK